MAVESLVVGKQCRKKSRRSAGADQHNPRVETLVRDWNITVEETKQTNTSILTFGRRRNQPVVLKVLRRTGDEWYSGKVLKAFDGRGTVRVYEHIEGAVLLERIVPGAALADLVLTGHDDEATGILAAVIRRMGPEPPAGCIAVEDWSRGFDRYLHSADGKIPRDLVKEARDSYLQLSGSQTKRKLLHGDLHHNNVLFDANRGWLAVDPKGVVGEVEYEVGAALRNPIERPDLFVSREIIQRRIDRFEKALDLDGGRALRWGFAQAVLSVIWSWEDGVAVDEMHPVWMLAREMRTMLEDTR